MKNIYHSIIKIIVQKRRIVLEIIISKQLQKALQTVFSGDTLHVFWI